MKVALLVGSTGLIGSQVLDLLLSHPVYSKIIALSRTPIERNHEKLKNIVADLETIDAIKSDLVADDVFCCLGTTIKKAGSQEAFRKVDFEYPLRLATVTRQSGAKQFLIITALGANKNSNIFYNRVKGEVEVAIGNISFHAYKILRPSLLIGDRNEKRLGEDVGKVLTKYLGWMMPRKYRGIEASKVANAMVSLAQDDESGAWVYESDVLQNF